MPAYKRTQEVTSYDLSSTGTLVKIETDELLHLGWMVEAGTATDFVVEIQPEGSTSWYEVGDYQSAQSVDDGKIAPEAFAARIRNVSTANDTANAVIGGADV